MASEPTLQVVGGRPSLAQRAGKATLVGLLAFSVFVSAWFFLEGRTASVSSLSGDQINILTVCIKKDQPFLLEHDLVVGDPRSVEYYTPWFVDTVRWLSGREHDYCEGLNRLLFLTSLVYFWGWWLLFSRQGDPIVAGLLAFLARGVMWPPGSELWGIAGLWTMLPRTLFLALLPWVLWAWLKGRTNFKAWVLGCFGCGLLANVHPISGACLATEMVLAEFALSWCEYNSLKTALKRTGVALTAMLAGMAPYIYTYWVSLGSADGVDPSEFEQALRLRVGNSLLEPVAYLHLWLRPKWLVITFVPWVIWVVLPRRYRSEHKAVLVAMAAVATGCLLTTFGPFLIERLLKASGHEAHLAFQLVRVGKYLLVPSLVLGGLACLVLCEEVTRRFRFGRGAIYAAVSLVLLLTLISRHHAFDRVPYLGDDACRMLWPGWRAPTDQEEDKKSLDGVLGWISEHTSEDKRFVGPRLIRVGALRPVIHDWPGAGMLIEGNPKAFVAAWKRQKVARALEKENPLEVAKLYAQWGADFWVTKIDVPELPTAFAAAHWRVYDLGQQR